jgi:hypothetical protein
MFISTYLVLITTKNAVIRCLLVPTWSQKFEEHLVGIIQHCSAFACDESNLDEKASKETFVFHVIFVNSFLLLITTKNAVIRCLSVPTWCSCPRRTQ